MFDKLSEDLVAAAVSEACDGGQQTHWDNLMVLHPHLNLLRAGSQEKSDNIPEIQSCLQ